MDDPILILVGVFVAIVIAVAVLGARARAKRFRAFMDHGRPATGLILEMSKLWTSTSMAGQRYECRAALLDIEHAGETPYEARVSVYIPKLLVGGALPGTSLEVRVLTTDPKNVLAVGPGGVYFAG